MHSLIDVLKEQHALVLQARNITGDTLTHIDMCTSDEELKHLERLVSTLYKLSVTLTKLSELEHKISRLQIDHAPVVNQADRALTRMDCEMILSLVREWGLLKEGYNSEKIEEILKYHQENGGLHDV
jgi:hypothetical protein